MQLCDQWLNRYYGKIDFRDYTLLDRAARTLLGNILHGEKDKPLPWHPWRGITPSHLGFRGVWNWDTAFHAIGVARWDMELAREQILMFLKFQNADGLLPDVIFEDGRVVDDIGKPPVMPWAAMIIDQRSHDLEFIRQIYPAFVKYENHWCVNRGGDRHGLFNYDSSNKDPATRLIHARYESGWDNAVRWDDGIYELWPIDLNCFMVMLYRAMGYFAEKLHRADDVAKWRQKEKKLTALIEEKLWDNETQAYLDYHFGSQKFVQALSPASFMPLYIGIAQQERAAAMAQIGGDRNKFTPGWPSVAYDHPQFDPEIYWRGRTWLNVAYFALKGLKQYGFDAIAEEGRQTLLQWVANDPAFICENYNSQNGRALGVRQFSWSAVFICEFILNWE